MGTETAIARYNILSGTHAIAAALYGITRPGDEIVVLTGPPYDTLEEVFGTRGLDNAGSLHDFGVSCRVVPLCEDGLPDPRAIRASITPARTRVAHIQRSCGYALRPTLTVSEIGDLIKLVKEVDASITVTVDNCYGEFTERREPGHVGADAVMGSLIKNPGGTIVTGGGYVAGRSDLMQGIVARLFTSGFATDRVAVSARRAQLLLQGLHLAPVMVGEALKGGRLLYRIMSKLGYEVTPAESALRRPSFITAITCETRLAMTTFCERIQRGSPVGSYVQPVPGVTPGYEDEVIFADGTFVDGSTAELSADGPIRPPYVVYCQGGTHWTHWANVMEGIVDELVLVSDDSTNRAAEA